MNRFLIIVALPFFTGCLPRMGDEAIPIVCSTQIPETKYSVYLHGPSEGAYFYVIETDDGDCGHRDLGAIAINPTMAPTLEQLGIGLHRVTWGDGPEAPLAEIDTRQRRFVADSNPSNPKNTAFEKPRYLRPEYIKL